LRVFIDTNLCIYRLDCREPDQAARIGAWPGDLAAEHEIMVSTQVLIEPHSVLTRKFAPPFDYAATHAALEAVAGFEVVPTDQLLVLDALALALRGQLAWFDALIVEAAIRSGCCIVFNEDLRHGRRYANLEVRNPLVTEVGHSAARPRTTERPRERAERWRA
jgi:predicted nucleic acid-binding protein